MAAAETRVENLFDTRDDRGKDGQGCRVATHEVAVGEAEARRLASRVARWCVVGRTRRGGRLPWTSMASI